MQLSWCTFEDPIRFNRLCGLMSIFQTLWIGDLSIRIANIAGPHFDPLRVLPHALYVQVTTSEGRTNPGQFVGLVVRFHSLVALVWVRGSGGVLLGITGCKRSRGISDERH